MTAKDTGPQPGTGLLYAVSALVVLAILFFLVFVGYYRDPLGDDVLSQVVDGGLYYIDGHKADVGRLIDSFPELLDCVKWNYLNWGGRVVGFSLTPLMGIFGHKFTVVLTAFIFLYTVLLGCALVFNDAKEPFRHPLAMLMLFSFLYYFNTAVGFLLMWTFTSIYIVSVALLGTYYYMFQKSLSDPLRALSWRQLAIFNVLGFFAGFTHEVFSFTVLSLVVVLTLREILERKSSFREIFRHTGLFLGTVLCVTAPGNFARLANSHDAAYMVKPIAVRLALSVKEHVSVVLGIHRASFIIMAILAVIVLLAYAVRIADRKRILPVFIKNNYVDMLFLCFVAAVWGVFPYTPAYGCFLFVFWFGVAVLKNVYVYEPMGGDNPFHRFERSLPGLLLAVSLVFSLCVQNCEWMVSMARTTSERRVLVTEAIRAGLPEVTLPRYGEMTSNRFTFYNYNNYDYDEGSAPFYITYFGIRMRCIPGPG